MTPEHYTRDELRAMREVLLTPNAEPEKLPPGTLNFMVGTGAPGPCPLCETPQTARPLVILLGGKQVCRPCSHAHGLRDHLVILDAIANLDRWPEPTDPTTAHYRAAAQRAAAAAWDWIVQDLRRRASDDPGFL